MADYYDKAMKKALEDVDIKEVRKKQREHFLKFNERLTGIQAEMMLAEEKIMEEGIKGL